VNECDSGQDGDGRTALGHGKGQDGRDETSNAVQGLGEPEPLTGDGKVSMGDITTERACTVLLCTLGRYLMYLTWALWARLPKNQRGTPQSYDMHFDGDGAEQDQK
jgi:hypothetical protein